MIFPRFPGVVARLAPVLVAVSVLALAGCTEEMAAGSKPGATDLGLVKRVMDKVQGDYVVPVTQKKLVVDGLKGMLTGLDPHSDYLDESEYQELIYDSDGEFAGIGIELTREDGPARVISPIDDTPAARAGVKAGDFIARINGEPTDGMSLSDAVEKLRGPAGSAVASPSARKNTKPFDVTLTRAVIHVDSVKSKLEPGRVGYVRIISFGEKTQAKSSRRSTI